MNYSLISNSCVSMFLYKEYEPNVNETFINYTNPFISSWFPSDNCYISLCEKYDYYTSIEPRFDEPINYDWEKDTGSKKHIDTGFDPNYLVMFLGDIEIHWIHDINESLLLKKFKGRLKNSKKLEPIFLWSDPEMFNIHTEREREELIKRFNKIKHKTIFLTKYQKEEYEDDTTIVKYIPAWDGKSQYDRSKEHFLIKWYNQPQLANEFKKIIDNSKTW